MNGLFSSEDVEFNPNVLTPPRGGQVGGKGNNHHPGPSPPGLIGRNSTEASSVGATSPGSKNGNRGRQAANINNGAGVVEEFESLGEFLQELNCGAYFEAIRKQGLTLTSLGNMSSADIEKLRLMPRGPFVRFREALRLKLWQRYAAKHRSQEHQQQHQRRRRCRRRRRSSSSSRRRCSSSHHYYNKTSTLSYPQEVEAERITLGSGAETEALGHR